MFDAFLRDWAERHDEPFEAFDRPTDYDEYVDGKPRLDGVESFLESRGIDLPMGSPSDPPEAETVHALGTRKNDLVLELIQRPGRRALRGLGPLRRGRARRRACAARSSPRAPTARTCSRPPASTISSRPASTAWWPSASTSRASRRPTRSCAGARMLGAEPAAAAVFEDAQAGVQAGRAGNFGWVVGVDRTGQAEALQAHAAPTSSSRTSTSCCEPDDRPGGLRGRAVGRCASASCASTLLPQTRVDLRALQRAHRAARQPRRGRAGGRARARFSTRSSRSGRCRTRRPATAIPRRARR